jgi:hypothetical protein
MKAILMYGEMFMGVIPCEDNQPEIRLSVSKTLTGLIGPLSPYPVSSKPNMITMTYKIETFGRKYSVYQFNGFE